MIPAIAAALAQLQASDHEVCKRKRAYGPYVRYVATPKQTLPYLLLKGDD
jgi:hypothetical protein